MAAYNSLATTRVGTRRSSEIRRVAGGIACSVVMGLLFGSLPIQTASGPLTRPGACEREAVKLVGKKPVRVGGRIRAPKQLRDVKPQYPEWPDHTVGSGMWIGEVLIDSSGKVAHIWPLHEVELTPPFPAFNKAIADAIRQWEFEPVLVRGQARPVCLTVEVHINWK